jgi:hypothetical protein
MSHETISLAWMVAARSRSIEMLKMSPSRQPAGSKERGKLSLNSPLSPQQKDRQFTFNPINNSFHFITSWRMAYPVGHITLRASAELENATKFADLNSA